MYTKPLVSAFTLQVGRYIALRFEWRPFDRKDFAVVKQAIQHRVGGQKRFL